ERRVAAAIAAVALRCVASNTYPTNPETRPGVLQAHGRCPRRVYHSSPAGWRACAWRRCVTVSVPEQESSESDSTLQARLVTRLRSHTCGSLRASHAGEVVRLGGWVHRSRDLGGLVFLD